MPPKNKQQPSQKNKEKKKAQQVQDKTFGLKNKNKSSKVQKYVQQVEAQAKAPSSAEARRKEAEAQRKEAEKLAADKAREEARQLFASAQPAQKVPFGVDPKSVVCTFYKQGACTKGKKCKFSHDLSVERKGEKKDLYSDAREDEKKNDTMDEWDEEKLRKVVLSKHGNPQTTTEKVCKYFIEAVENGKYGWFWTCPNGGDTCKYRHSLPPGFVLKTKEQRRMEREAAANEPSITLEEFLETERHKLPKDLTPVTWETFTEWKKKRQDKKEAEREAEKKKKAANKTLSGRELMMTGKYDVDDDDDTTDAWDMSELSRRVEETEEADEE